MFNPDHFSSEIQQLHTTLSRMTMALAHVDEAIAWTDTQGRVEWCNAAFDRLINAPHDAILLQPLENFLSDGLSEASWVTLTDSQMVIIRPPAASTDPTPMQQDATAVVETAPLPKQDPQQQTVLAAIDTMGHQPIQPGPLHTEDRLRLTLSYSKIGSWFWHIPSDRLELDENAERLLGLQHRAETANYQTWYERIHSEDAERTEKAIAHALITDQEIDLEYRVVHPDGSLRWIAGRGRGLINASGEVIQAMGVLIDITDRKLAEIALAESEAKFCRLAANVPGMIYRYVIHADGTGEFVYISPQCQEIFGIQPQAVLQNAQILWDQLHHEDWLLLQKAIADATQTSASINVEYRITTAEKLKWIQNCAQPEQLPNGDTIWDGVATDISDRKFAEAQLKQQQDFLRMIIDTNPNLIFVKDWEGKFVWANQALAEFYDTAVEELLGKRIVDMYVDPEIVQLFLAQNQWVIHNQQPLFISEEKVHTVHQGVQWFQWQKQPIRLPDRDEYAVLGIGVNITEHKRTEAALESILQGTASATGAAFFPVLVQSLVSALGVQHALVSELTSGLTSELTSGLTPELTDDRILSTLAFWSNDKLQPNFTYALDSGPACKQALEQGVFRCADRLKEVFPNLELPQQIEAVSYLGVTILDSDQNPIGVLCILDTGPLKEIDRAEALLRIFAARAGAELERNRAITALQQLNHELEARVERRTRELQQSQAELQTQTRLLQTILNSMGDGLVVTDVQGNFLMFNPAAEQILGFGASENRSTEWVKQSGIYLSDRVTPCPPEQLPLVRAMRGEAADNVEVYIGNAQQSETLLDITIRPFQDETGETAGGVAVFRDITKKKAIEEALRQREQEFRTLVEHSPDMITRFDAQTRYLYVNPKMAQETGIAAESFIHKTPAEMGFPDRLVSIWMEGIEQVFLTQQEQKVEYEIDFPSGRQFDVARCVPEFDTRGNVRSVLMVSSHITDLKRTEAALRESESQLRAIFENAPIAIGLVHPDTLQFIHRNAAHREMFGYSDTEITQLSVADISHPEDLENDLRYVSQLLAGTIPRFQMQKRYLRKENQIIWANLTATLIHDPEGTPLYIMGMSEDISDRKKAEQKLLIVQEQLFLAQERLQHLLSSSPAIIYSAVPSSCPDLTFISPNVALVLGYQSQDCFHPGFWLSRVHPEDLTTFTATTGHLFQQGYVTREYRIQHQDGAYRWIYDQAKLVFDEAGSPIEWIGSWMDISDRKAAEKQLYQTNERLALINAELARATRLKDEFLANMSHELRTPLNSILGLSEVMQEELFGPLTDKQRQFLNTIQSSGKHLLELINDILDLAKIEAGMLELSLAETSIQQLCEASLALIQQQAHRKNIKLYFHLTNILGTIQVDERRMRQVLLNLLSNAIKFTPEGGKVTLEARGHFLENRLSFSVIDTGIGIATEDMEKLFQTFVQIDSSLARHYEGTGLGLVLVKQIVEMHGGEVSVVSTVGVGSCFTVMLPWAINSPIQSTGVQNQQSQEKWQTSSWFDSSLIKLSASTAPSPLILLAEDHPDNVATLADYLQAKGFQLILAKDGIEAVEQAIAHRPQLILMDIQMPRMDGLTAIRQIRAHPSLSTVPIIALTALAMAQDQEECRQAGANAYLTKPVRLKQLVTLIQQYVEL